jgi:copper chaperone NosL
LSVLSASVSTSEESFLLVTGWNWANREFIFKAMNIAFRLQHSGIKLIFTLALALTLSFPVSAAEKQFPKPSPKDKCPVCGMFVAKYPDWITVIRFQGGAMVFFDGVKDMFKYYFDLKKYAPSKKVSDIDTIQVTNYYDLTSINGFEAFYVVGSDVYGPMGRELIPFAKEEDAKEFLKDHKGKLLLKFKEAAPALIKTLD